MKNISQRENHQKQKKYENQNKWDRNIESWEKPGKDTPKSKNKECIGNYFKELHQAEGKV